MPKKLRELKSMLLKAGFSYESAKGSHTKWSHPAILGKLTLSGKDGVDAKAYLEQDVVEVLQRLKKIQEESE